jgi:hypothetical protein
LGDREWLSDIHLANLMFLLLYGQLPIPVELRDVFQCLYPMTDQLLEQMLHWADPGSLLMHAKMGHGVTLVFLNPNNNHWRLVVLDGIQRQVVLFDPLGLPLPSSLRSTIHGCDHGLPLFFLAVNVPTSACINARLNALGDSAAGFLSSCLATYCPYRMYALLMAMSMRNQASRGHHLLARRPMREYDSRCENTSTPLIHVWYSVTTSGQDRVTLLSFFPPRFVALHRCTVPVTSGSQ